MSSSCISALDRLELLGRRLSLNSLVGLVRTLKLELTFLRTIVNWILSLPSDGSFKHKVRDLQETYWSINDDVIQLYPTHGPQPSNINIKVSRILERVKHIKPSVKEVCDLHLKKEYPRSSWLFQSDYIMEFISDLQDNLKDLFRLKAQEITPVKKQIEVLEQKLEFLTDLTVLTTKHSKGADEVKDLMVHIRAVTDNVILVSYSCLVEEIDESMTREIKFKLSDLLLNIKLFNPQVRQIYIKAYMSLHVHDSRWMDILEVVSVVDFILLDLMELLHYNSNSMVLMKGHIGNLLEKMKFLKPIFVDLPVQHKTENVRYLMRNIHEVINDLGPIIYSFSADYTEEDVSRDMNRSLLDLLESIELTEEEFRKINLHKFPSTDELRSFDFILENLNELLTRETDFVAELKHQIDTVHKELLYLRSFLDSIKEPRDEHEEQNVIWRRIIVVAYRAEFVVDSIEVEDGPACYHMLQLETVVEEIKNIKAEIIEIYEKKANDIIVSSLPRASIQASIQETTPNLHQVMVGFEEEAEALKELLMAPSKRQNIFAIVGMPGLGKTTLAKKLYYDPSFEKHFDVRAWCCVSKTYQSRDMLLAILGDVIELPDKVDEKKNEELAELLYKSLKGLRYLIVMDDMWDVGAWNALRRSFPDDKKRSRILITSRFHDVALQATPGKNIHTLRLFHDDKSWKLLQEKLFYKENCPRELSEAGKKIAKNCKGLPLAVVLAAGVVSTLDRTESQWQQFAKLLSTEIVTDDPSNQCMAILEMSYRQLPDHLKSCFLYFGAFPENQEISVKKLAWLWMAEGFVHTSSESLNDVAEYYLMDLIGRSLVIGSKSTFDSAVKSCHIHDLLRDFCLAKANEENFLHCVRGYDGFNDDVDSSYPKSSSIITYEQYRLSIYAMQQQFITGRPLGPNVRSLLLHPFGDAYTNNPYDASFICRCFKLLKILDLGCINIGDSLGGIELLINLRFLAVRGNMGSIPSSIANLWRLETLLLKRIRSEVVLVPNSIWNMMRLRHVHINDIASFGLNPEILENSFLLEKLETFSTPSLAYGDDVEKMLRKLPNLRKLTCIFLDAWDHVKKCNQFPELSSLSQLISLKVFGINKFSPSSQKFPCEFHFPLNLRKLTLSDFSLPWSEFSSIGNLPNLEVLKLLQRAFEGKSWDMKDVKFPKLKHLKLESLDIVEWKATTDHIPCLERLVLRKCKKLQEIPPSFGRIPTLEMIEVKWCSSAAANAALDILGKEDDLVNKSLKVHIYPKVKESGASSKEPTSNQ